MAKRRSQHFGKFLVQLREYRGLTQVALAEGMGVHPATISKQEVQAEARLSARNVEKLVNYLQFHKGLTEDELLFLKAKSRLRDNYEYAKPAAGSGPSLEIQYFEKHFPGEMRDMALRVAEVLTLELGAKGFLTELLKVAAAKNIQLRLEEDAVIR